MRYIFERATLAVVALAIAACDQTGPTEQAEDTLGDNAVRGQFAFVNECASCHASGDGVDLATFQFTDTTIIRRALGHVDHTTALNIVAYIRTLHAPTLNEDTRVFQPTGLVLSSDGEFAQRLFGSDAFPAAMTTDWLRSIDPRQVSVAVKLPIWSDEASNLDWMPDTPLPAGILDDQGSLARAAIAGYRAAPTQQNLARAVSALRNADRRLASSDAPCLLEDTLRVNFTQCFEARRWTSSLVAQHLIRYGVTNNIDPSLHAVWWDVGNAARKSIRNGSSVIANAKQNWAAWMYLSWSFAPSQHPSVYTGGGLNNIGLPRHATFVALRSEVARPVNSKTPYEDVRSATAFAPNAWAYNVAVFGLKHLLERLNAGDRPEAASLQAARDAVNQAVMTAQRKVAASQLPAITELGQQVQARLQ